MGGYFSSQRQICYDSTHTTSNDITQVKKEVSLNQLSAENREKLDEFKLDLARKHERRREILAEKRREMEDLRKQVALLKQENELLRKNKPESEVFETIEIQRLQRENEELKQTVEENAKTKEKIENLSVKNNELRVHVAEMQKELQVLNSEAVNFEQERQDYHTHVVALKDVIKVSKHMLQIREAQLKELKEKVENIEETLASREMNILSQDLREEYERQLQNIRYLRDLYEERYRANKSEKKELASQLEETKKELEDQQKKTTEQNERIAQLEAENSNKYDEIKALQSDFGLSKAECREYQAELTVINQLFSQILLSFSNTQAQGIDLDKLKNLLEENHGLLQNIVVNEISKEVSSTLPKVLLDLVNQVQEKESESEEVQTESEPKASSSHQLNSVEEIVENLPKVWRVLIELLSHQKTPTNIDLGEEKKQNPCYKRVETNQGPNLVISVSQTYIHLKNLILEKKSLEKETNNLKQLNGHLESRLQDQEKRLSTVTSELSKTWHVVGKLQKQHNLLHTQEKILRYELAQKRKLLGQLREELEYSREKWLQAREKNSTTEREWKQLRKEFASRRNNVTEDINNSCESGYSDDRECSSSDDEPGYETDISECNQASTSNQNPVNLDKKLVEHEDILNQETSSEEASSNQNSVEETNILEEKIVTEEGVSNQKIFEETSTSNQTQNPLEETNISKETSSEEATSSNQNPVEETNILEEKIVTEEGVSNQIIFEETSTSNQTQTEEATSSNQNQLEETNISEENASIVEQASSSDQGPESSTSLDHDSPLKTEQVQIINEEKTDSTSVQETNQPSTSQEKPRKTLEEVLAARDARLKRLESEAKQLVTKVTNTNIRSVDISKQLDDLHEVYGESSSSTQDGCVEETQSNNDDDNQE